MFQLSNHYRLSAWSEFTPGCNESAGKRKSIKIYHTDIYLKLCLVKFSHCAVKDRSNNYYANKFNKISKRYGKKHSYIAIARKILVAIYHMLSTGKVRNHTDLVSVEAFGRDRIKYTKNNLCESLRQLLSLILTSDDIINLINQNVKIE